MAKRAAQPMPEKVRAALAKSGVAEDYGARPAYQRNDYLRWISKSEHDETRAKRIAQMIDELKRGGVYMGMAHRPSRKA